MEVLVRVDMVEGETRGIERLELRLDLGVQLITQAAVDRDLQAHGGHVRAEVSQVVDELRYAFDRQRRPAFHQDQMKTHAEAGQGSRAGHGIVGGVRGDHQARCGEDAVAMCELDCFIDFSRRAEIVGRDDQGLHAISFRRRRNSKNSSPSRKRRLSMSKSRSISPTIAPIFRGRK